MGTRRLAVGDYVLIVDDDPDVIRLVMDVVENFDMEGKEALNGQRALELVTEEPPCAIVLDMMMPVMDGFDLIAQLQRISSGRIIPIIVLSALADVHNDSALRRLPGVIGVLSKGDFSMHKLKSMLALALGE
jgi:CheY-like chemotaxis protein